MSGTRTSWKASSAVSDACIPSFSSFFSRITPGGVHVDDEQREAVVARVRVGLGHEHDEVRAVAVGDVGLGAVDHPLVAVAHGARADALDVGAGVGLGDAEAGDLLALDRRHQVVLLLLLGAELQDRRRGHVGVHRDAHREPAAARVRELLGQHEVAEVVAALTAVRSGIDSPRKPSSPIRGNTESGNVVSSHSSACGASSLITKLWIDSRSASCSSVKMKCRRGAAWSGFWTSVAAIASAYALRIGSAADGSHHFAIRRPGSRRNHRHGPAGGAQRALGRAAGRPAGRVRAGRARTTTCAWSCSRPRTRRSSRRAAT